MRGSVIKRMYAGFGLIIILFAVTIAIMMSGMNDIHGKFQTVSESSLPLVSLSNQTSVELLSADKSFKDFLTTENKQRMDELRQEFAKSQQRFESTLEQLKSASEIYPSLAEPFAELKTLEQSYFTEAIEAMDNYEAMFAAQDAVQKSSRRFQKLNTELSIGLKEYVDDQSSISVKVMAKSYFIKLKDAEVITSDALASSNSDFVTKAVAKNRKAISHLNDAFRGLTAQLPELKKVFGDSVEQFTRDVGKRGGVLDQHNSYLTARSALYANIANLTSKVDATMAILEQFTTTATDKLNESLADAGDIYSAGVTKAMIIGVVVVLFAAAIGYHIAHSVREPLTKILNVLESLTEGDMTQRIDVRYKNEFSRVSGHINSLADSLHNILVKLNDASENLASTAATNEQTSSLAQRQLNSQREQTANVATAMTEMSHSVQEVAQNAQSSMEMVQRVESASEEGRNIMSGNISTINQLETRLHESVSAVSELQKMSAQIGSILDVIRNIAEQTNLLALNAAIEAARAGDQGRGFAVVADEVRVLASRTTESTTEIESMISNLQSSSQSANHVIQSCMNDMEESVEQASKANSSMEEIQALIIEISQMSTHISQAAAEQSETSADIARSIEDINNIADESYQAMSNIAQTSESLTHLAHQQNSLVHRFTL
ncbi:methyl-accepting chemotaxis protein [Vibrio natriegens]|uniref:Chemotaxis protein n=1 Tax=Vibrio natriegens NBRC 15636 = ATCC 14048 = DSM 759 TaxID=1219067 RepID=A0AAN1CV37_VIBNA|nr:methyl-accepting chemotaxis protein [Vibrio natriegens]ALR16044.1 chemotaxis protein [Vibrio natriegens NBRC 15636 = ATCC 14048 = DSM 759]ANQ12094.1 chemotaxis protein [Vibrio natriegens NBRC 15636 = ATCC 14048 = DSM 759]MDX6026457.1 methyl-accepting chemotaxis protein [Vibrio natriegens NBRC 15636 = ATCC 14048 = DSM 759]UUI12556.1 methyl-accepting chemotaxis protein [Vibrio natriegens]WRS49397.1 methyl-accepting chemotaxis protein [Vibrio natriegens NBRC 15636 = ATCC 14048 = DSM 759]